MEHGGHENYTKITKNFQCVFCGFRVLRVLLNLNQIGLQPVYYLRKQLFIR